MPEPVLFAAVGDVHGQMHAMIRLLTGWERSRGKKIEFVLQVRDFEPHRTEADLATMAAPAKYRRLGDFQDFYKGKAFFPWPVYFIGGNHEPYGFLDQAPAGAQITENCFYLGRAGAVELAGLKIAGLSGIYRHDVFALPRPPIADIGTQSNKAYIYFTEADVEQVLRCESADILILHEWPAGLTLTGEQRQRGEEMVGNEYARLAMEALEPGLVLCGHMHERYHQKARLPSGRFTEIYALANVEQGKSAFAVFQVNANRTLMEVTV